MFDSLFKVLLSRHDVHMFYTIALQVKVSLHKNGMEAAYLLFYATGQDMASWFDKTRIMNSSWNLAALSEMGNFGMEG